MENVNDAETLPGFSGGVFEELGKFNRYMGVLDLVKQTCVKWEMKEGRLIAYKMIRIPIGLRRVPIDVTDMTVQEAMEALT